MAKQSGLGDALWVDEFDLSGDIGSLQRVGGGPAPIDLTGIDKSAFERAGGVRQGLISYVSFFNDAAGQSHLALRNATRDDRITTYCRGVALGSPAASLVNKQINYDPTRAADGGLTSAVEAQSNAYGLEWGNLISAGKRTDTGATAGASFDLGSVSPGAFGAQFYLHVFSFAGTDATVKVQESSDNAVGDAFADVVGGGFTAVTAVTKQRIATGAINVERYLRVTTTTVGGFTSLVFGVMAVRNPLAVTF